MCKDSQNFGTNSDFCTNRSTKDYNMQKNEQILGEFAQHMTVSIYVFLIKSYLSGCKHSNMILLLRKSISNQNNRQRHE